MSNRRRDQLRAHGGHCRSLFKTENIQNLMRKVDRINTVLVLLVIKVQNTNNQTDKPNKGRVLRPEQFEKLYLFSSCNWGQNDTFRRRHPIGWLQGIKTRVSGIILIRLSQDENLSIFLLFLNTRCLYWII